MTRFARAQGSKSSNERTPHEATAWTDMKEQFISKKNEIDHDKRKDFLEMREKNYKHFLTEHDAKQTNTWADFSEVTEPKNAPLNNDNGNNRGNNKKKKESKKKQQKSLDIPLIKDKLNIVTVEHVNGKNRGNNNKKKESKKKQQKSLDIPLIKDKLKTVTVEHVKDIKKIGKIKKCKKIRPESVEHCQTEPTVVEKVEKVFANNNERLLYEKKLARRVRQKEKVMQRKAILAANEDNLLTQKIKEKVAKIKEKRLQKVLARKVDRERLKGISEKTEISTEKGCTEITSKKNSKKKKKNNLTNSDSADVNEVKNVKISNKLDDIVKIDKSVQKTKFSEIECQTDVNENKSNQKNTKKNRKSTKRFNTKATDEIEPNINNDKINKKQKNSLNINSLSAEDDITEASNNNHFNENFKKPRTKKDHKLKNSKWTGEHRKKVLDTKTTTLRLNGKTIEIALLDGFPVRKDDYERLTQLRKEMISKGVPRSEVQRAMQLERRRAEKALAREKKEVCFHCRKAGHKLTDCPNAMLQETEATGICFKCGSTEHTHFECKVVPQQQFKFATCFICREPGHISKQCPQNTRGIYPKGGCCKVCGDVTHLKKDCPQYQAQQEHNAIQADTIDGANLEALEKSAVNVKAIASPAKKAKVVKF